MWYLSRKNRLWNLGNVDFLEIVEGPKDKDDSYVMHKGFIVEQFPTREVCRLFIEQLIDKFRVGATAFTHKEFMMRIPYEKRKQLLSDA